MGETKEAMIVKGVEMKKNTRKIGENQKIQYMVYNLNQDKKNGKKILLACHGFCSDKNSNSIKLIAERFSEIQIPVISFDWPAHGTNGEDLNINNCISVFKIILEEILKEFPNSEIFLYGSSFGAYLLILLLSKHLVDIKYKYCFLKSPAIKMDEILKEKLLKESFKEYKKRGYTIKNKNKKMIIPYKFYEELKENKLDLERIKKNITNAMIFHGTEDEIASIEESKRLECYNIKFTSFLGAKHSFNLEYFNEMIQIMLNIILYCP